jgi:hypothetical protein
MEVFFDWLGEVEYSRLFFVFNMIGAIDKSFNYMDPQNKSQDSTEFAKEKEQIKELAGIYERLTKDFMEALKLQEKILREMGSFTGTLIHLTARDGMDVSMILDFLRYNWIALQTNLDVPLEFEKWSNNEKGEYFKKEGERYMKEWLLSELSKYKK